MFETLRRCKLITMLHVLIHCPDRHIVYDGNTPDEVGVGGGVTARIRLAAALARLGHHVELMANCPEDAIIDGVRYIPLGSDPPKKVDVLIHNTSGGGLDLTQAWSLPTRADLVGVWASGTAGIHGLDLGQFDTLYVPSNFIRGVVVERWHVPVERVMVMYNAIEARLYLEAAAKPDERDPFRVVYLGHPIKGLEAALGVFHRLRQKEPRTTLHIYGGKQLWGQHEDAVPADEGVIFHGMIGQRELIRELSRASFVLFLQEIEEAFGISLAESLRAGCICLASPVGAIPELVQDSVNGVLLPGDHRLEEVQDRAAQIILKLMKDPERGGQIRQSAQAFPWNWDLMARAWSGYWGWKLGLESRADVGEYELHPGACPDCAGGSLRLADGDHCLECGRYTPK